MGIPGSSTKVCPDCGESVPAAARKCRYCGYSFRKGLGALLRRISWIGAVVLVLLGSVLTIITPKVYNAITNPLTETDFIYMRPWDFGKLNARLHVAGRYTADTCVQSIASSDPEALRCFPIESNEIQDPCWTSGAGLDQAACLEDPWDNKATILKLPNINPPPVSERIASPLPWALELANKQRCVVLGGATGTVANMRVNYGCINGGYVVGEPDKRKQVWKALFAKANSDQIVRVSIRQAWA